MRHQDLREYVIRPVLESLSLYSKSAEELLVFTAATESLMGYHLHQVKGPAVGIYQMEPTTHDDIWNNYLDYREIAAIVVDWAVCRSAQEMIWNLAYATAMARVHYYRFPEKLPSATDKEALAAYWKRAYNTPEGKGSVEKALCDYYRYGAE